MGFQQPSQALCPCITEVFPAATLLQETGGAICKPSDVKAAKSKFRLVGGREEGEGGRDEWREEYYCANSAAYIVECNANLPSLSLRVWQGSA